MDRLSPIRDCICGKRLKVEGFLAAAEMATALELLEGLKLMI